MSIWSLVAYRSPSLSSPLIAQIIMAGPDIRNIPIARRIFLVGFMGSGKSTVGRSLARKLGYDFFDLDGLIEARCGRSVRQIFEEQGEGEFRRQEREALISCRNVDRAVIALGGGAYISEDNRALLRDLGVTVWLDCPLDLCLSRLGKDASRPLLGNKPQMSELLRQRRPAYEQADFTVHTGGHGPRRVAAMIADLLLP